MALLTSSYVCCEVGCKGSELENELEEQQSRRLQQENEVLDVSKAWAQGTWSAAWGPEGPRAHLVPGSRRRKVKKRTPALFF